MERNKAIDILKFFAVLLIVNSHFDEQYTCCKELATGGAIGDALFFFCSGYTLFLGRLGRFDAWYKRRIRRIYPSVIALAFITILVIGHDVPFLFAFFYNAGWFVGCIMIYYVLLYFIQRYALDKMKWVYGGALSGILLWYASFFDPIRSWILDNDAIPNWLVFCQPMDKIWIYQWNYFKWGFFFLFMLMGANLGKRELGSELELQEQRNFGFRKSLGGLMLCIVAFYVLPLFIQVCPEYKGWLILSLIPLAGICFAFYGLCKTDVVLKLLKMRYVGMLITGISSLCLEIYLVQPLMLTKSLNHLFPLNLLILFVLIVLMAYLCRTMGRFIQQTFSSEDGYDWSAIFKI